MKKLLLTICTLLFLFSSGCTSLTPHPRAWTTSEKKAAIFYIVAHTANALTTEAHQNQPELYYEVNPILGRHPSDLEIGGYFSLTGIITLGVTHLYPELREPVLYGYGAINCHWTIHDLDMMK
ncbi:MAG TPA: hypothetical protein VMV86_05340 [Methanosarcinales archaeon]|nr:hypothetical protein [Methanosarcinales archaeon]